MLEPHAFEPPALLGVIVLRARAGFLPTCSCLSPSFDSQYLALSYYLLQNTTWLPLPPEIPLESHLTSSSQAMPDEKEGAWKCT